MAQRWSSSSPATRPVSRRLFRLSVAFALACLAGLARVAPAAAVQPPGRSAVEGARAGQGQAAVIGTVLDSSGAPIAGAVVTLKTSAGERRAVSDSSGRFQVQNVPPGQAVLVVTFDGFASFTANLAGSQQNLRIVLEPAPLAESVTVRATTLIVPRISTATRTDTPLRDVPQSVSVITRDLIADQTMGGMADVVRYAPGVGMAQGEGHRDAPILRGITSTADFFVNGVRDDTQYLRDLYNVERVEILKGPNGMIFGRGGVGGVINRVTRQAGSGVSRELSFEGGSWGRRRLTGDVGRAVTPGFAARLTGLYEHSDTYRHGASLERYGVNPTVAIQMGNHTTFGAGYELFRDERTVDRGIPSLDGRPVETAASTFFGDADLNTSELTVNAVFASLQHRLNDRIVVRNRTAFADYDKFYQNLVPGAVDPTGTQVSISGYNSRTQRQNLFNQTDFIVKERTGPIAHTVLAGVEIGRQATDNRRLTGFFSTVSPTTASVMVPLDNPATSLPVEFRPTSSDAGNSGVATVAALYAQDQIVLSPRVQAIIGLRYDRVVMDVLDRRTDVDLASDDGLVSPRLGFIYKPSDEVSLYATHTRSYLPRAGEQLSSLSPTNQALDPEEFRSYEVGAKWEVIPALAFTAAAYRLDHGNVVVADPSNPTVSHLVDAERATGLEVELGGSVTSRWNLQGGYAYQRAEITRSLSSSITAGARLGQVPAHSFSLWNKYDVSTRWGVGLGVISRSDSFVATDNTVVLPAFTRVDGAVFLTLTPRLRVHFNLENVLGARYYPSAHNNNNIAPGSPRALWVALRTRF